jgi:putative PIN family toxin of toxin-antitoxin system
LVADANVLVSATLVEQGPSARILSAARNRRIILVVSPHLLGEYRRVIQRPHIAKKYPEVSIHFEAIIKFLHRFGILVSPLVVERVVLDDPADDFILATAVEGRARFIVSGDKHLLALRQYRGIKILAPREFVTTVLE